MKQEGLFALALVWGVVTASGVHAQDADDLPINHTRYQGGRRVLRDAGAGVTVPGAVVPVVPRRRRTDTATISQPPPPPPTPPPPPPSPPPPRPIAVCTVSVSTHPSCPAGMVWVPPGDFTMGGTSAPRHVNGFCMDRTEVTVDAYRAYATPPTAQNWNPGNAGWDSACNGARMNRGNHPINCVDWHQAESYCRSRGWRLPTETEWEYAAQRPDGREYPWGNNAPDRDRLNACGPECVSWASRVVQGNWIPIYSTSDLWETTAPVGTYTCGATVDGLFDMAGNVWEWTSSEWSDTPGNQGPSIVQRDASITITRVVRGGGWDYDHANDVRARFGYPETYRDCVVGFRCASGG